MRSTLAEPNGGAAGSPAGASAAGTEERGPGNRGATWTIRSWSCWFSVWSNMAARLPRSTGRSRQQVSALLHFPADLLLDPQALDANQARGQAQFFRQS